MARNIVPPDGVNSLTVGTKVKRWLNGFFGSSVDVANGANAPVNSLQRSTAYAAGDIVQSDLVHAKYRLVCTTAGTTGATDPNFAGVSVGGTVTDGTAVWTLREFATLDSETVGGTDTPVYVSGGKVTSIGATLFSKIVTHLASSTAASISSLNTSSLFYRMLSWALTASGVQYNFSNSSAWYICMGNLLGGLIIQGGRINTTVQTNWTLYTLPISYTSAFIPVVSMGLTNSVADAYVGGYNTIYYKAVKFDGGTWSNNEPLFYITAGK